MKSMYFCATLWLLCFSVTAVAQNQYALIIGISHYKEVAPLQFADRDAIAFADFLKVQQVPEENIKLFLNENAVRFNIVDELYNLTETLQPKDRFYFYFGGHGDLEAKIPHENSLLLLYNSFKTGYFQGNEYLQLSELKTWFEAMTKKQVEVVFIADACHSGGLIGGREGRSKTQRALQESWVGITKMLSSQVNEFSLEGKQWGGGRGLFSYHLINGLTGLADADKDKKVTLGELRNYLAVNVIKEANPNIQTPVVYGNKKQLLSKIDNASLKKLRDDLLRSVPTITEVNIKAKEEKLIGDLDKTLTETYNKFRKALDEKRLNTFDNEKDYALLHYRKLAAAKIPNHLLQIMKRNLGAGLLERELVIMENVREKGQGFIRKDGNVLTFAIANLEEVIKLFGGTHYIYNFLKARIAVLESQMPLDLASRLPHSNTVDKNIELQKEIQEKYILSAKNQLLKGLQLEPNMISTYTFLSNAYRANRQPDSATYYQEKVVDLLPNQGYVYQNLASNYMGAKYVDANNKLAPHPKAIAYLEKAIEVEPSLTEPYLMLADMYMGARFDEANRNYAKAIPILEKIVAPYEAKDQDFVKQGATELPREMSVGAGGPNSYLYNFLPLTLYWVKLYFVHKATGNREKADFYLNQLLQKAEIGKSSLGYIFMAARIYSLLEWAEDENDMKIVIELQLKALKKKEEELNIAPVEDKPLLTLKYREQLKAIGSVYHGLKNYPEAERYFLLAIAYPMMESPILPRMKLVGSRSNIIEDKIVFVPNPQPIQKKSNGDYIYFLDAYTELFLLKWEQNKPDEAFEWLEKAFQLSAAEHGNDISGKPFEESVFDVYKNMDKERFKALKTKYFPPASSDKK